MLEALPDSKIAPRLVGFDVDSDDSLDDKYRKLNCDITPLPHNSEDFRLIEKYLLATTRTGLRIAPSETPAIGYIILSHSLFINTCTSLHIRYTASFARLTVVTLLHSSLAREFILLIWSVRVLSVDILRKNPVDLMLLSKVASREFYELTKASLVKMQFLLKVRFHHKR
ncbi:hypothetical protein DITRI_Ditri11bG0080500 [Diplodiscus trichospermus]